MCKVSHFNTECKQNIRKSVKCVKIKWPKLTDRLHPASPPAINKMANSLLNFVPNFKPRLRDAGCYEKRN